MKLEREANVLVLGMSKQKGIALVVALVLLIAVTLLGLAAIRGTSLQEKMAGNSFDREISFQASEAALNVGADQLNTNLAAVNAAIAGGAMLDCTNPNIYCHDDPSQDIANNSWINVGYGTGSSQFQSWDAGKAPQYVIQRVLCPPTAGGSASVGASTNKDNVSSTSSLLSGTGACYRVTARNLDPQNNADRAVVLLQAVYKL